MVRVRINWQRLCFTDIENSIKAVYRVCVYLDLDPKSTRFKEVRYVDDCLLIVLLVKEMTNCDQLVWKKHYVSDLVSLSNSFCSLLAYHSIAYDHSSNMLFCILISTLSRMAGQTVLQGCPAE